MKRFKKLFCAVMAAATLSSALWANACTVVAAGKDATDTGAVQVAHTCDGWYDHRIQIVEGGKHAEGETVDIYNDPCTATKKDPELVGTVPQVPETYTYFNIGYPFMNEKGVIISEFTWNGRSEISYNQGLLVVANLEMLGLQRAATARECVQVMGALAEQYGYCDGGECLLVADQNEVWIFEVCGGGPLWTPESGTPGAHWAARRVPDDQVFVGANRSRLGVIDFNDTENFMWSTDITALPEQLGWWKQGEDFNFSLIFNPTPYGYPFYASRREWRAFSLLAPSQEFELIDRNSHYEFSIVPDEPVSIQKIMHEIYSDHLEGTEYDMTKGLAAGPFGNPTRWQLASGQKPEAMKDHDWEREIAQFRCTYSFVAELRPDMPAGVGSLLWFGQDSPDTTVYVPLYAGTTEVPESWATGDRKNFDPNCAWWAFNFVNNYCNLNWAAMYPVIRERKFALEQEFFDKQAEVEAEAVRLYESGDEAAARAYLTNYVNEGMNHVEDEWWAFAGELVGHFYDGMRIEEDGSSTNLGYPTEWLEAVGFGETSAADLAKLNGEEPAAPAEPAEPETPAETEKPDISNAPVGPSVLDENTASTAVNTSTSNTTAMLLGLAAVAVVAVAAVVLQMMKNKKK